MKINRFLISVLVLLILSLLFSCTKDEKLITEPETMEIFDLSYSNSILTWKSSESTRSIVQYSTDSDFLNHTAYSIQGETTNHSIIFLDLNSDTTYYYRIKQKTADTIIYSSIKKFNSGAVSAPAQILKVVYIDVKQGDSELIKTPEGNVVLIDGGYGSYGAESWTGFGQKITLNYLKSESITSINYLILTHPHADHVGGLADVLSDSSITKVDYVYDNMLSSTSEAYIDFLNAITPRSETNYALPELGSFISLDSDQVKMKLIHNKNQMDEDDTGHYYNDCSLTYHLEFKNFKAMFQGDAETVAQDVILSNYPNDIRSQFYKVGHHGSYNGTSRAWMEKMRPVACYIPCGAGNPYGHPHNQTLTILEDFNVDIYRADQNGTVILLTDGENNFTIIREK